MGVHMRSGFFILMMMVCLPAFGMGSKPININPGAVNFAAFPGEYTLVKSSGNMAAQCKDLRNIRVTANAARGTVQISGCSDAGCVYEKINHNRDDFDSCFSDGMKGYRETVGNGNTIVNRTIHIKHGFLCTGKSEACRQGSYLSAGKDGALQLGEMDNCFNNTMLCEYQKR
jgi:hypothetical protein